SGAEIAFIHTEVDAEFSGKGLGEALIRHAITDAAAREQAIVPRCSAVKSWLDKHPEFDAKVVGKGIKR
ncbi:MAG: N-acetyltransferase, partial [Nocardia sp.]|nr:N-acetyltransferase [Nocardia sp.]